MPKMLRKGTDNMLYTSHKGLDCEKHWFSFNVDVLGLLSRCN